MLVRWKDCPEKYLNYLDSQVVNKIIINVTMTPNFVLPGGLIARYYWIDYMGYSFIGFNMGLEFDICQAKLWNKTYFFFFSVNNLTLMKMDHLTITQLIKMGGNFSNKILFSDEAHTHSVGMLINKFALLGVLRIFK